MKKPLYYILILIFLTFLSGFKYYEKPRISISPNDVLFAEDASNDYSTSHILFDDIINYFGYTYTPYSSILVSISGGMIDTNLDNTTYPWSDNEISDDLTIAKLQFDHNVEILTANKTLVITDKVIQKLDPDGTDRDVLLPPEASNSTNLVFFIYNMGGEVGEDLNIQDDNAVDILSVGYLQLAFCTCDGTTWVVRCFACAGAGDVLDLRAKEENTSAIVIGQPVYISGATGIAYPDVGLADCDDSSKIRARGLAAEYISQNSTGYIRAKGLLEDVDSTKGSAVNPLSQDWTAGDQLWVSTTVGGLTNVRPIGRSIKAGTALTVEGSNSKILVYPRENSIYTGAASGEDIIRQMGDSAGANKISYTNFAGNEVASLNSDGNATFNKVTATWNLANSITALSIYTGAASLDDSTNATKSGAYIVKCFDEFANSNGTNIQDVLDDLDAAIEGGGGGGNNTIIVKEDNVTIDTTVDTLDFLGADFDLTESPEDEVQIVIAPAIARDSELIGGSWTSPGAAIGTGTPVAITATTVDTGQGANELHDMNQNVETDDNVTFNKVTAIGGIIGGPITGRIPVGSDITGNQSLNTTDLHGKFYIVTAACTVTLDKVTDVGFGASVILFIRDAAETCIIEVDNADKINRHGTAQAAGNTIDSPGNAGDYVCLISHTDVDGSGTDGWIIVGYGEAVWTDGGAS